MFLWCFVGRKAQIKIPYIVWFWLGIRNGDVKIVGELLLRAASEPNFRRLLLTEPTKVLADYDISTEAKSIIKNVIDDFRWTEMLIKCSPPLTHYYSSVACYTHVYSLLAYSLTGITKEIVDVYIWIMLGSKRWVQLHKKIFQRSLINGLCRHIALLIKTCTHEVGILERPHDELNGYDTSSHLCQTTETFNKAAWKFQ